MSALHQLHAALPLAAWLLVDALAVYRLTRFVTRDSMPVIAKPRDAIGRRWGDRALGELVVCPWCVSWWVGLAVIAARLTLPLWWTPFSLAFAYSAVAGLIAEHE